MSILKRQGFQFIYVSISARKFDVNSAETMFHDNLRWRQQNKIDNIRNEDWSDMSLDFHATIDTYDRTGRPVCVIDVGKWDIRRTVIQGKGRRFIRYLIYLAESITRQIYERQEKGMNVTQMVVLGNADGFNLIQQGCPLCLPIWIQFIQLFENHYPESLDAIIIIDAPPAIQVVLEAMRPFFSRTTRNAIKIFGPNRDKWMPYLDTKISKDERRPQYGGTKPPFKF
ncbi:SEC14-like protein 2 [Orchesella cincta]|uniref:SEC14-like protein 2 n=1 Tax=Orchesella cincta TaxID=48709 RepID=A0A1D2MAT0_ORCCI|nr:SEC14-like protein 2 [Orchesella cincta]